MRARLPTLLRRDWALAASLALNWFTPLGAQAQAQAPAPPPPPEAADCATCNDDDQHSGLYIRLSVGLGATAVDGAFGTQAAFGGSTSCAVGYFVLPNLALSLDLFGGSAYDLSLPLDVTAPEIDVRSFALGASLTYYFPLDFYVSAGAGVGWLMLTATLADTQLSPGGFAFDGIIGKEGWIGGSWALGAGAQFIYVQGDGEGERGLATVDSTWSLALLFTVTKN